MPDLADAVQRLRDLAEAGQLARDFGPATTEERLRLGAAAFALAGPIVFRQLTRPHEVRRGHRRCTQSVLKLADGCLDRFYDDTEAVVADLLTRTTQPVHNLEGWITSRLRAVTIDAHRRRRSQHGALQRPRLPGWLARSLCDDPWLGQLALEILTWVGIPLTAGTSLWPMQSWADHRASATGDWTGSDVRTVAVEVDHVLSVMRRRPRWYAEHVEQPLGAKQAPVVGGYDDAAPSEQAALELIEPDERGDARLLELARVAIDQLEARLATGMPPEIVIPCVLRRVFAPLDLAQELAHPPHGALGADELVQLRLRDQAERDRIIRVVTDIVVPPRRRQAPRVGRGTGRSDLPRARTRRPY